MKNDHDDAGEKTGFGRGITRRRFLKTMGSGAAVENAEPMEQNEYKIPLFRGLIEQELMAIAQPGSR